jgi:hypothetical protein
MYFYTLHLFGKLFIRMKSNKKPTEQQMIAESAIMYSLIFQN